MHVKRFFEKYQHNFECALSVCPKIKITSPLCIDFLDELGNFKQKKFTAKQSVNKNYGHIFLPGANNLGNLCYRVQASKRRLTSTAQKNEAQDSHLHFAMCQHLKVQCQSTTMQPSFSLILVQQITQDYA